MKAYVSGYSQDYKFKSAARHAGIQHGADVRVNVEGLAITKGRGERGVVAAIKRFFSRETFGEIFFCRMYGLTVHREKAASMGQGKNPEKVTVRDLNIDVDGEFCLENARIVSNGSLQLIVDEQTRIHRGRRIPDIDGVRASSSPRLDEALAEIDRIASTVPPPVA